MSEACKHCGQRIVRVNFSGGPKWMHQHAGAAFQDGQHWHCHRTVAEPRDGAGRADG